MICLFRFCARKSSILPESEQLLLPRIADFGANLALRPMLCHSPVANAEDFAPALQRGVEKNA